MAAPRLSTVYDLSSLRLHTDGSRVHQTSANLRPRKAAVSVRDSRGNWIARDAGGSQSVGKYRRVKVGDDEAEHSGEAFDFSGAEGEEEGQVSVERTHEKKKGKGKGKGKEKEVDVIEGAAADRERDRRATKRRKFAHDFSFLDGLEPTLSKSATPAGITLAQTGDTPTPSTGSFLPQPSSDLLKCIHHFASTYYTERGQLFNASRLYRKERKERRLKRLQRQKDHAANKHDSRQTSLAHERDSEHRVDESGPELDAHSNGEGGEISDEVNPKKGGITKSNTTGKKKVGKKTKGLRRDMYKVMDGSALMAIGMLLQEHVAQLLKPRVPDGWEESMDQGWEGEGAGEIIDDEQMGVEDGGQDEEGSREGRDEEARETGEEEEEEEEEDEDDNTEGSE